MLAGDGISVSLADNRVVLALGQEGSRITDLSTVYDRATKVLTITAAGGGTLSTTAAEIEVAGEAIAVNLAKIRNFAGISVVGGDGPDSITIGRGGVNLAAVTRGAAAQGLRIDTGAGPDDAIVIAGPVVTKGGGEVSLATQGSPARHGILLAAGTRSPAGSQTFAGAVTLLGDVAIQAGGDISFSSTVDGTARLQLAAGRAITFAGDVGGMLPLQGVTLAAAGRVAVRQGLSLDGAGTAVGTSGLVVGANVPEVAFSTLAADRTIRGFSGAGIHFLGGSRGSRISGVTSTSNGVGLALGPGSYAGTVISGNAFSDNSAAGVAIASARRVTIGGTAPAAGNAIVANGGFGLTATGGCAGSLVAGNEIGGNALGQVEKFLASRLAGATVIQKATGLQFLLTEVGRASYLAQKARSYAFDVTVTAFALSARATGRIDTRTGSVVVDASVGFEPTPTPATPGPQPAPTTNRVATALTPLKTLPGIEFPRSVQFVDAGWGWQHYQAVLGLSTFAGMVPLADLVNLPGTLRDDGPITVDVWVNPQGSVSRVAGTFEGGSFEVTLRGDGTAATTAAGGGLTASGRPSSPAGNAGFARGVRAPRVQPIAATGTTVVTAAAPEVGLASAVADPLLPQGVNGVTGVRMGHSTLTIPFGGGWEVEADWYFPTQCDGTVESQGVIWLQHAFGATGGAYSELAAQLARQANSIVVAPTLPSFPSAGGPGWWLPGDPLAGAVASLFDGDRSALTASAAAAGFTELAELLGTFLLAGHSAGGGFATAVAAEYAAAHADPADLVGVVMYDGVSAGAFDHSGRFAEELSALGDIPVYQIAAPASLWNAYGATTNALMAARPGRFTGVVLVGGSHVDAMQGRNPGDAFVAQRLTKASSPGNAAAVRTLSAGWINDLFLGSTPSASNFGWYAAANSPLIMGSSAALPLPAPLANTLSAGERRIAADIDALGGLSGFQPGDLVNAGDNGLVAAVRPPLSNGVTGVKTATASLDIPCGDHGYATTADWYFPTQSDGQVAGNGLVWLQHGDRGTAASLAPLAAEIARQTNSVVVVPNIVSFEPPGLPGCFLGSAAMRASVAGMLRGDRGALSISANAAGHQGPLPASCLLVGYGSGGGFATAVGAINAAEPDASPLGVVMVDGMADPVEFAASFATLTDYGIPVYQIAAPPQVANDMGRTTAELAALVASAPRFIGVQIDGAGHGDFLGGSRSAGQGGPAIGVPTPEEARDAAITFATGWINDIYGGFNAENPYHGVYANPNDGTYTFGDSITMGSVRATVLPVKPA